MPLIESRARIAIADELASAEHELTHGMVDLAAALVGNAWKHTPLGNLADRLYDTFSNAIPDDFEDVFGRLEFTHEDTHHYGARFGFDCRTMSAAEPSWAVWLAEAESWLQSAACGVSVHRSTPNQYRDEFLNEVREFEESGRWRSTSSRSPDERKDGAHESGPPPEVRRAVERRADHRSY